jgi:hypothetical protein
VQSSGVHTQSLSVQTPLLHVAVGAVVFVYPLEQVNEQVFEGAAPAKLSVHVELAAFAGNVGRVGHCNRHC